mmetsp:Transcript_159554/g.387361  ORF Transcript_159554/g.387361 Transcript_159554/m.387361 type:complete len:429 (-) Transcript_159554:1177-2463(-)
MEKGAPTRNASWRSRSRLRDVLRDLPDRGVVEDQGGRCPQPELPRHLAREVRRRQAVHARVHECFVGLHVLACADGVAHEVQELGPDNGGVHLHHWPTPTCGHNAAASVSASGRCIAAPSSTPGYWCSTPRLHSLESVQRGLHVGFGLRVPGFLRGLQGLIQHSLALVIFTAARQQGADQDHGKHLSAHVSAVLVQNLCPLCQLHCLLCLRSTSHHQRLGVGVARGGLELHVARLPRAHDRLARRHPHAGQEPLLLGRIRCRLVLLVGNACQEHLGERVALRIPGCRGELLRPLCHVRGLLEPLALAVEISKLDQCVRRPQNVARLIGCINCLDVGVQRLIVAALRHVQLSQHLEDNGLSSGVPSHKDHLVSQLGQGDSLVWTLAQVVRAGDQHQSTCLSTPVPILLEGHLRVRCYLDGLVIRPHVHF